jgi:hypothetical protein
MSQFSLLSALKMFAFLMTYFCLLLLRRHRLVEFSDNAR